MKTKNISGKSSVAHAKGSMEADWILDNPQRCRRATVKPQTVDRHKRWAMTEDEFWNRLIKHKLNYTPYKCKLISVTFWVCNFTRLLWNRHYLARDTLISLFSLFVPPSQSEQKYQRGHWQYARMQGGAQSLFSLFHTYTVEFMWP